MSEPIRILNIFMVLDRGGAETFVMNVYRQIDRNKVQFDFLVHGDKVGAYEEEIQNMGGKIYRLPSINNFFSYKKAIKCFFDEHPDYKVIHSHASELGWFIFREANKRNIPYRICHAHNAPKGITLKSPFRFIFKIGMKKHSNVYLACSNKAGIWQFGRKSNFKVINNGIFVNDFKFNEELRESVRSELGISDKFVVGHVGRFERQKNHNYLIEIFDCIANRQDAVLLLIGEGSLRLEIEQLVKKKGLLERVFFLGSQQNVSKYLCAMDVFVFPSLFEGLPVTLIEAQANGLACYISDSISTEVRITDLIICCPISSSAEDWADKITKTIRRNCNRLVYSDLIKASGYGIEETVDQLQEFYLELVNGNIRYFTDY